MTSIKLLLIYFFNVYLLTTSSVLDTMFGTEDWVVNNMSRASTFKAYSLAGEEPNIKQSCKNTHTSFKGSLYAALIFYDIIYFEAIFLTHTHKTHI